MIMNVNGVNYHVGIEGLGEPLLFLHGFTGSGQNWKEIVAFLHNEFQCITIDIIGHGQTESPAESNRYDIEKIAKDLVTILENLRINKVSLIGYSMGGRLALATALLYPNRVSRLILESSSPGLQTLEERKERIKKDNLLAERIMEEGIEQFVAYWENIPLFESQKRLPIEQQRRIREGRVRNNKIGLSNSLRGMGTGVQPSYWQRLSKLDIPTLLICGELDEKFCGIAESMKKSLPNAVLRKIKGVGHAIHVEHAEFFGKIVSGFVKSSI